MRRACVLLSGIVAFLSGALSLPANAGGTKPVAKATIDFARQIRPILSDNCFRCHGPDEEERKAKLRLDTKEGAFAKLRRGGHAVVPGKPSDSAILQRILADEPSERMPPSHTNKKLTPQQIELLKEWIAQGASWSEHWAYVAPKRPPLPPLVKGGNEKSPPLHKGDEKSPPLYKEGDVKSPPLYKGGLGGWARNGIDRFILDRLQKEDLALSPEADRTTLIRRLTLDLTGLPPSPEEVDAFLADKSPNAYEKLVDRLLASPHYGERMAVDWLDAARYADTHGYHIDSGRDMTRWREWVIDAFNTNMPFDQFTVEQLAGDLLPNATIAQKVASGFNRNHMINFEGGAIPAEYHNAYIVDRVNTTATVWFGLTVACAQCHDHKYDPISQREFYQLYAFFHNVPESGLDGAKGNAAPVLKAPTKAQQEALAKLDRDIEQLEKKPEGKEELARLRKARAAIESQFPSAMVMQEMPKPRDTFVLLRGEYNKKGDKVAAGVPAALGSLPPDASANRLGLARWLVAPSHPLTARVIVNRYWQMFFGTGLVKTVEDFGSQGEQPSHPELLDWLAVEFQQQWSIKDLVRLIVTSATYRQSSKTGLDLVARDPENRLLARGPRFRLQAEFIRDQALAVAGLLNREIGGRSVSPYQPSGLWQELASRQDSKNWSAQFFVQSKGQDLYRRTMYTFWKRTSPPPQLVTFDAPDREICTVRRGRTNTPLQALVLMNDPTYVEAARKMAERLMKEAQTTDDRVTLAFRLTTARPPSAKESGILRGVFEKQRARFADDEKAALKLLAVGEAPRDERLVPVELAAWTIVANVVLNLDETLTKN